MKKYFASCHDEGPYSVGPHLTEEAAIEEAKLEYQDEIAAGSFIHLATSDPTQVRIDADNIIDEILNNDFESELYEDALSCWCDKITSKAKDELSNELTEVFHRWLEKNGEEYEWDVLSPYKHIEPSAPPPTEPEKQSNEDRV